jgi:hypothetical protein
MDENINIKVDDLLNKKDDPLPELDKTDNNEVIDLTKPSNRQVAYEQIPIDDITPRRSRRTWIIAGIGIMLAVGLASAGIYYLSNTVETHFNFTTPDIELDQALGSGAWTQTPIVIDNVSYNTLYTIKSRVTSNYDLPLSNCFINVNLVCDQIELSDFSVLDYYINGATINLKTTTPNETTSNSMTWKILLPTLDANEVIEGHLNVTFISGITPYVFYQQVRQITS